MSTTVTYVGTQYRVPAYQDTGYAQGSGNLSSYLIALATGSLTLSGGSFPLTADADFGANFGLESIYYKSRATFVASTGILRIGNTEKIGWRDNANGNDILIACNATQTGGATYTIPDTGATTANFVMTAGTQTIGGVKTFSTATSIVMVITSSVQNASALSLDNTAATSHGTGILIKGNGASINAIGTDGWYQAGSTDNGLSYVNYGANPHRWYVSGTTTPVMTLSASGALSMVATSNQLVLGVTRTLTITAPTPAVSSRVWTIPDISADGTFAALEGTQTFSGTKTFSASATFSTAGTGIVLKTPDGSHTYLIAIDNDGNITGTQVS